MDWESISEYVAAGNLIQVAISDGMDSVEIDILYSGVSQDGVTSTANISLQCLNCGYFDMRRREDHEPGSGMILEAYLHTESQLISALHSHQLDSIAGCLKLEADANRVLHLEIIGEITVNMLCEDLTIKSSPMTHVESVT